jgi:hypothetical protein
VVSANLRFKEHTSYICIPSTHSIDNLEPNYRAIILALSKTGFHMGTTFNTHLLPGDIYIQTDCALFAMVGELRSGSCLGLKCAHLDPVVKRFYPGRVP